MTDDKIRETQAMAWIAVATSTFVFSKLLFDNAIIHASTKADIAFFNPTVSIIAALAALIVGIYCFITALLLVFRSDTEEDLTEWEELNDE